MEAATARVMVAMVVAAEDPEEGQGAAEVAVSGAVAMAGVVESQPSAQAEVEREELMVAGGAGASTCTGLAGCVHAHRVAADGAADGAEQVISDHLPSMASSQPTVVADLPDVTIRQESP